jgi:anti-sigma B factor antagonist
MEVRLMTTPANPKIIRDLRIEGREGKQHRLVLRGELDLASAPELTQTVAGLCADGVTDLVLELSELEFIDSTGLHAILHCRALCEENACALSLMPGEHQVQGQVRRLLEVTGLQGRLPFRESPR